MKKLTALSLAAFASTALVASDDLTVTLGGFSDFQVGLVDQEDAFKTGAYDRSTNFQNDTELHFNIEGKTAGGLVYGAVIELEADISSDASGEGLNADKTYIYLQNEGWGRFELGGTAGASDLLKIDASSVAAATGGVSGDWYDFVDTSGGFIIRPDLPTAHGLGDAEDANKISYYSPRFSGLQLGLSYAPDTTVSGTADAFSNAAFISLFGSLAGTYEDVIEVGVNYKGASQDVTYGVSLTGQFGDSKAAGAEDLEAYAIGAELGYREFSLAASYGDWQESGQAVGAGADQDYFSVGVGYENGPVAASVTYLDSEAGALKHENIVVGAEYNAAAGLTPYAEVSIFDLDDGTGAGNEGTAVLLGTQLNF